MITGTLCSSTSSRVFVLAVAGLPVVSCVISSTLRPASMPPRSFMNSAAPSSCCLPPAASGPVLTVRKPIRIGSGVLCAKTRPSGARPIAAPSASNLRRGIVMCFLLVEGQHGAGDFARLHRAEGVVDVAELAALCHHRIEVQAALAVEIEIERDVGAETVRAHARGLHLAFRADRHPRKLDRRVGRQHADNRRSAADRETLDRLPAKLGVPDRLESVIDAGAASQRAHRLNRIVFARIDEMRRADAPCDLLFCLELIDSDDLAGTAKSSLSINSRQKR